MRKLSLLLSFVLVWAAGCPLFADSAVGSNVTGALYFDGDTLPFDNFFSVDNGGSGDSAVIGPGVEFTYSDAFNTDTAEFDGSGLTITDVVGVSATDFSMVFTDPAFTGFTQLSDNSGFTYSFAGDTLTVNFAGALTPGTYNTTLAYSTPEPSSLLLFGTVALVFVGTTCRPRFAGQKGRRSA
jgi:hypothetical protein